MAVTFNFTGEINEQIQERENLIKYLADNHKYNKVAVTINRKNNNGEWSEKKRITLPYSDNGELFAYRKRSRRWGSYLKLIDGSIQSIVVPEKRKSKTEVWEDSWKTALGYLEQSKLFPKYADNIRIALDIGYEGIKKADRLYWDYNKDDCDTIEELKKIHRGLASLSDDGKEYPRTEIIWRMSSIAKVKTIYFGKYDTNKVREELRQAMNNGEEYRYFKAVPNYYDVSVSFYPETMTGSYNEEYRNCGNGHYYLLLDHEHALFYEDD